MEEKVIRNIALICSVVGLVLLYYAWVQMEAPISISRITIDNVGTAVTVCGNIEWKNVSNNHVFMRLEDITGKIGLIIFNTTALRLNESGIDIYGFSQGEEICSTGVVKEYPEDSGKLGLTYRRGSIRRV